MTDSVQCGAIGGMQDWQRKRSTGRNPAPVPLWPPQIPHLSCLGLEPKPPRWEEGDYQLELRRMKNNTHCTPYYTCSCMHFRSLFFDPKELAERETKMDWQGNSAEPRVTNKLRGP
jgi:hypothetical protein